MTMGGGAELSGVYSLELIKLAERWGVRADTLLSGLGTTPEALAEPGARVSLAAGAAILDRARRLTGEPALAVHMGLQMRLSSHGFLGFAAMTASTVRQALDLASRYVQTRAAVLGLRVDVEDDTAALVLEERAPLGALWEFIVVALFVGIPRIGSELTGQKLRGAGEVTFPQPEYLRDVAHVLPGPVRFGRPENRLVFPACVLDFPLLTADAAAMELARAQCEREMTELSDRNSPVGRVRAALLTAGDRPRPLEEVARRLRTSARTLKRDLAAHGTTFSAVRDEVLCQRALALLEDPRLSVAEVAARMGYSDAANFTRAFKKWTGKTPAALRER